MYKVLIATEIAGQETLFPAFSGLAEFEQLPPERETVLERIGEFDAYIATLRFRADREFLDRAVNLKAIFTATTGLDHIDLDYAAEKGIAVYGMKNDREFLDNITATAELALTLLLALLRNLPWSFDSVKQGQWNRERYKGHQLSGKTMGILGYGRLGTILAQYARALRMKVLATDIKEITDSEVQPVSLDTLLRESDVLSIHVHLDDTTRHLIDRQALGKMKPSAVLVNTSRGGIVDEAALLEALESGRLAGAAVDVIDGEWMENKLEHPMIRYAQSHENLLISPHLGGACYEAQLASIENVLEKLRDFLEHGCAPEATETLRRSLVNRRKGR